MSLSLPEDAEVFIPRDGDFDDLHGAGVYVLTLTKPDDLEAAWDAEFDSRPDYFDQLEDCEQCWYVGESGDVLSRLEDHRDGDVRVSVLMQVCEINTLRNIFWCDSKEEAKTEESKIAIMLQNEYGPSVYVHSR